MAESIRAWHFTGATLRDGRPLPPDGEPLVHTGPMVLRESGLHASRRIMDALRYAPGNIIHRVECRRVGAEASDILVCCERVILWRVDGEALLRRYARRNALDMIHRWDAPDVMERFLRTGDESLRAAAGDAARAAAAGAAAAGAAAWAATRDAAWVAARDGAWVAVTDAATDAAAAGDVAVARQERRLVAMVHAERRRTNAGKGVGEE